MPDLSVCIVNWNTRRQLRRCLESLRDHSGGLELQVIVVDNASSDGSAEMVRQEFAGAPGGTDAQTNPAPNETIGQAEPMTGDRGGPAESEDNTQRPFPRRESNAHGGPSHHSTAGLRVQLIANADNRGYAAGNNQAIAVAQAPFILLLNPDVVVAPGSLQEMIDCARRHPRAGAVAPRLLYPDGRLQHSCRTFPTPEVILYEVLGLSRLFPRSRRFGRYRMTWWDYDDERMVDQPMASSLLLRRDALLAISDAAGSCSASGPRRVFDESFPIFFNDVDLCWRLWESGWEIWFTPGAVMIHDHGASTSLVPLRMALESYRGLVRFYAKHYRSKLRPVTYWCTLILLVLALPATLARALFREQMRQRKRKM